MKFRKGHMGLVLMAGALVVGGGAYTANTALASDANQDTAMITVEEVRAIVQEAYPDYTFGEIELENDTGTPVYDVEASDKGGIPYDIEVEPNDGTILKIQLDDDYSATGVIADEDDENDDD